MLKKSPRTFAISEEDYLKLSKMAASPSIFDYRAFANSLLFLMLLSALCFVLFNPVLLGRRVEFKEVCLYAILFLIVFAVTAFGEKAPYFQMMKT